ncbi:MAG: nucleotidyltransferase domain-containing protein [Nitrososphaerales archaeon]
MSIEYNVKRLRYLKNCMEVARMVKKIVLQYDSSAEVYVFGSVVKDRVTVSSDIDILVLSDKPELEDEIKVAIIKSIDAPVEIHFATHAQYENCYKRFIDAMVRV